METVGPREVLLRDAGLAAVAFSPATLRDAWAKVWQNEGAAGGDGVTVHQFQRAVMQRLSDLAMDLDQGTYMPGAVRRVLIPKPDGGQRPLDIPCVRDRVVHTAITMTLGPKLDEEFEPSSFGYRAGRGVRQAVDRVSYLRRQGFTHVVDADIERFFERVDHHMLMERLGESMDYGPLSTLIAHWLEHAAPTGKGLAQGSPLSPLLANLYLDRLDEALGRDGLAIVRYADDFVVLARSVKSADDALAKTARVLAKHGLTLNAEKSRVTDFDAGFRFLGHVFVRAFALADPDGDHDELTGALRALAARDATEAEQDAAHEEADQRRARAALDPGQRVLYLTREARQLTVRNYGFCVRERISMQMETAPEWTDLITIHADDVDRIELGHTATYDHAAVELALATGTEIAFVNGHGETMGYVTGGVDGRAARQLAQARATLDPTLKLALAKTCVEALLRNRRALLRRLNRTRADDLTVKALAKLNHLIRRVPHAPDIDVLRGLEGHAAAQYWPAFGRMLNEGFSLKHRTREGADPVNIMLNMTAHLLARDCRVAIMRAGLHPGFGALHEARDHSNAAVYDVMEAFRAPLAEAAVASAINQRSVTADHFQSTPGQKGQGKRRPMRLTPDGTRALIRTYERLAANEQMALAQKRRRTWRMLITDASIGLAQAVEAGEPALFAPHIMDY
ncbi:MAG: CRISPR-associated endonuclease Cas1 [Ahrensia sp.]